MNRFNSFNYNKEDWELVKEHSLDTKWPNDPGFVTHYLLRELSTSRQLRLHPVDIQYEFCPNCSYFFLGIEQISDHDFLTYGRHGNRLFLYRYYEAPNRGNSFFSSLTDKDFFSLSKDLIWLGDWQIYSIRKNCILNYLESLKVNSEISIKYRNGKHFLFCKKFIDSDRNFISFMFDIRTFKPVRFIAYSSLRRKQVKLSDSFTFKDLIEEDEKYSSYISSYFEALKEKELKEQEEIVNAMFKDFMDNKKT